MRIAICSDFFEPELSGVTDSILLQAESMLARGHDILFLVPSYPARVYKARAQRTNGIEPGRVSGAPVLRLPSTSWPFAPNQQSRIALPGPRAAKRLRDWRPDIIHTHSPFVPGMIGLYAARAMDIPLIGTHHTPFSEFMGRTPGWIVSGVERFVGWYYNHAAFVSAPCQSLLDHMQAWGLTAPNGPVANPVALDDFGPARDPDERARLKREFGLPGFTVLCTGRLAAEKHVDLVIRAIGEAATQVPDITLAITGKGQAENALRSLTARLGLGQRVRFFGLLDYPRLVALYKAADAFAMMSTAESQSLSLMQAMASGLPSIVANTRAFPEYIDGSNGTLVEPGDFRALAGELVALGRHPDRAGAMARSAMARVGNYAPPTIAAYWESIYADALAGSVPAAPAPQAAR